MNLEECVHRMTEIMTKYVEKGSEQLLFLEKMKKALAIPDKSRQFSLFETPSEDDIAIFMDELITINLKFYFKVMKIRSNCNREQVISDRKEIRDCQLFVIKFILENM